MHVSSDIWRSARPHSSNETETIEGGVKNSSSVVTKNQACRQPGNGSFSRHCADPPTLPQVLPTNLQFSELADLFGSFQTIRLVHFLCMSAIVGFVLVHVTLALLVPQSLVAMIKGGPVVSDAEPAGAVTDINATH